ncbi:MAG TPA: hypothetical protein VMM84_15400 [Pyrinomonadaceae bacterium]|nr:hypothetical protein [Pyrinomonadaceae bacterium]
MRRTVLPSIIVSLLIIVGASSVRADLTPPASPANTPGRQTRAATRTSLTVVPDAKVSEARLEISGDTLRQLSALANGSQDQSLVLGWSNPQQTIIAGLFLMLSVSFAGVWFARSRHRRNQKVAASLLLAALVLGTAAVGINANIAPPSISNWRGLPKALNEGRATNGSVTVEIVADGSGIKLIIPMTSTTGRRAKEE